MNNKIKYSVLAVAALFVVALAVVLLSLTRTVQATDTAYYVDCSAGSNGSGTQASPWNNLTTVNGTTFGAGDQILFKRGTTCSGTLSPQGSGASGNPIIIDAYSTGNKPIIAGGGASNAVYLYNQQYWEIRNLEVTNTGASSSNRRGVYIKLENFGTGNYYRLTSLTVHNVNGDNTKDQGGSSGIHFDVAGTTTQTKFNDVILDGNTVYTVDRSGINMSSAWWCRASVGCSSGSAWYPWTNFIIRNSLVYDIGGDGIVLQYGDHGLVEYNVVHDFNMRSGTANAGIWPWNADYTTFQYNEAYNGNTSVDGQGFDIDYGTVGTVMQYNYSHDNDGGFMLLCTGYTDGNNDGVVRYNVSQNDLVRVFQVGGPVKNMLIYNNTVYIASGLSTGPVVMGSWNGNPVSTYFYNNIFYNLGSGGYTLAGGYTFDYNIFYGNHPASEPSDAHKITANPLLVNPGSGGTGRSTVSGYQLQAGSPALAAGKIIASNGGLDYWGNAVPASCAPDIGAHQYSSAGGCPTPTPSPTPDPTMNYVQNPGFETGSLSPWTQWNNSVVASNAHTGTYSMQDGTASASGEQTISGLTPNTAYVLKGWVKTSATSVTANVGVKSYGGTETYVSSTSTSYTELTVNFTTGAANTTALIYCYKPTTSGYVYCDDFSVKVASSGPTPTPTNTPIPTNTPTSTPTNTATPFNSGWIVPAANAAATGGDGDGFGTNPANAYSDNATFAVDTNSGTTTSTSCSDTGKDKHVFYTYNLSSVPSGATILGLEVQLQMKVDSTSGTPKSCLELSWDGGTTWTAAKTSSTFTKTETSYTLGGAADTWGHSWTQAELSNLRVRITNVASNTSRDFSMDWIPVRVTYR